MRIGDYVVRPDAACWIVASVKKSKKTGEEYEADVVYPGRFDQALRTLLDHMVRDGLSPDADVVKAVETVAHLYATIGRAAEKTT